MSNTTTEMIKRYQDLKEEFVTPAQSNTEGSDREMKQKVKELDEGFMMIVNLDAAIA